MKQHSKKGSKDSEYALVYSTDPTGEKLCSGCHKVLAKCVCPGLQVGFSQKPSYRIERKGRGGKTATVISNLPAHETFLKELSATLKRTVGGGGTYYIEAGVGTIEIQGERLEDIREAVEKYKAKKR